MMTRDLRTISTQERNALRERAVEAVRECGNISQVSRDIGINRQVLHRWLNRYTGMYFYEKRRGRTKQRLSGSQTQHTLEILAYNLPSDLGIDSTFWSVRSVGELLHRTMGINSSAYLAKKWLLGTSIFYGRKYSLFEESSAYSEGLSVRDFAEKYKWPCYVFWRSYIKTHAGSRHFQCVSSKRGSISFVGEKCEGLGQIAAFLSRLQKIARKNIVIVYDEYCKVYFMDISRLSNSVVLFRRSNRKLKGLNPLKTRLPAYIRAFLEP